jgi:hypothetical protein
MGEEIEVGDIYDLSRYAVSPSVCCFIQPHFIFSPLFGKVPRCWIFSGSSLFSFFIFILAFLFQRTRGLLYILLLRSSMAVPTGLYGYLLSSLLPL